MTPLELKKLLDGDPGDLFLLDVREQEEYDFCHLEHTVLIPMSDIPAKIHLIPVDKTVVVYCHYGVRSQIIVNILRGKGYTSVHNLEGGIDAYATEIDQKIPRY